MDRDGNSPRDVATGTADADGSEGPLDVLAELSELPAEQRQRRVDELRLPSDQQPRVEKWLRAGGDGGGGAGSPLEGSDDVDRRQVGAVIGRAVPDMSGAGPGGGPGGPGGPAKPSPGQWLPAGPAVAGEGGADGPGGRAGPYRLLDRIGEGGMGVVYAARQESPVRRTVAVKVIKPGMDSAAVVARFEAERQALAMMEHANIARVYDAGTDAAGRPYFVMELAPGVPITHYCDDRRLTPRERLELFLPVCRAVQHAHQKGVIHRDLKPSNILVTVCDGRPVPKVIDFGVAKALHHGLAGETLFTRAGTVVGTPQYMSPEQAGLDAPAAGLAAGSAGTDTRSDIYSLGVLLYELLTGSTPLAAEDLGRSESAVVLRAVREHEPPAPSARLAAGGAGVADVAAARRVEPRELARLVAGDLDWIVMKCLEKDRARRYATAEALARDLERYLNDEPVEASPPSARYRVGKFARKHRAGLRAAAGFASLLVAATVLSTCLAVRATRARNAAAAQQAVAERAVAAERLALESEAAGRRQAEAVAGLLESAFRQADPFVSGGRGRDPGPRLAVQLDEAAADLERDAAGEPLVRARMRNALGVTQLGLGAADKAVPLLEAAVAEQRSYAGPEHPQTLAAMHNLARAYHAAGRTADAIALFEQVRDARARTLGPDHADTLSTLDGLAWAYESAGRTADAVPLYERVRDGRLRQFGPDHPRTLTALNNLGNGYRAAGRPADAIPLLEQVVRRDARVLGTAHPQVLVAENNLALAYYAVGRYGEAVDLFQRLRDPMTRDLGPDHPDTLTMLANLASAWRAAGRTADAIKLFEDVRDRCVKKFGPERPETLTAMTGLATAYQAAGRTDDAIDVFKRVLDARGRALGASHPDTRRAMNDLAGAYRAAGRTADAEKVIQDIQDIRDARDAPGPPTARRDPTADDGPPGRGGGPPATQPGTAAAPEALVRRKASAVDAYKQGRYAEAAPQWLELAEWCVAHPEGGRRQGITAPVVLPPLVACYHRTDQPEKAAAWEQQLRGALQADVTALSAELDRQGPAGPGAAQLLSNRAFARRRLGQFQESLSDLSRVVELRPADHMARYATGCLQLYLDDEPGYRATCRELLGRFQATTDRATAERTAKVCLLRGGAVDDTGAVARLIDLAWGDGLFPFPQHVQLTRGIAEYRGGRFDSAVDWLTRSRDGFGRRVAGLDPWNRDNTNFLECQTTALFFLSMAEEGRGRHAQATEALARATDQLQAQVPPASSGAVRVAFEDWLIAHIAAREAGAVVGRGGPATAPAAVPTPVPQPVDR